MALPRLQLFEFNDLGWVPSVVRDTVVESLSRALQWGHMLDGLVPPLEAFLDEAGTREVLDLASGAGGPAQVMLRAFRAKDRPPPRFLLTDLHPRLPLWEALKRAHPGELDYVPEPVDATCIPAHHAQGRARVIINALHHLPPSLVRAVLADAVRSGAPIFISEAFDRQPLQFANFAPTGLAALALNPLLSPRERLGKALFTWLTPAALLVCMWDGLVSTLRVYSEAELREMVASLGAFRWSYGRYSYWPFGQGCYFYGVPARPGGHQDVAHLDLDL